METADAFGLMATAYRTGLLDKAIPLIGLALEACQKETGLDYGDVLMRIDEARKETIEKVDRFFNKFGFLLRLADNERLLGFCARLMDRQAVQRVTVSLLKRFFIKALGAGRERPPLPERMRVRRAGIAASGSQST